MMARQGQGRRKLSPSRSPLAAILLVPFLLLALAAIRHLVTEGTRQPLAVQQLLQVAQDLNMPLAGRTDAVHAAAPTAERRMRVLMLGHDLTLTGAPQAMLEIARHLRKEGHSISFIFLRGGPLAPTLDNEAFQYSVITDVQTYPHNRSALVDPSTFDVVVVNTVVTFHWVRHQVEAWGLGFLRKAVWWIREHPLSADDSFAAEGRPLKRHLVTRCGAAVIVSDITWRFWEAWGLEDGHHTGLDYSPLLGRQESFGQPLLPQALPNMRVVRNPLPPWIVPLLDPRAGTSKYARPPECKRTSRRWPHAELRRHFRQLINAADEDYVIIIVGTHAPYKGTDRLVTTFARAWQLARSLPSGAPGTMHLVCIGKDMLLLEENVRRAWADLQQMPEPHGLGDGEAPPAASSLPAAIHLLDATPNSTERLGWYAAADVQVLNSECESFGRTTVEGMAASLPLLATACGGTLEIVQEGVTGLLHPPPSAGEAADAALLEHILLLDHRTARGRKMGKRLGAAGCRRIHAEFMPQQYMENVEAMLRQVASDAAAAETAATTGLAAAPDEGLTPGAAKSLRSGWAAAYMPTPTNQARVVQRDMGWTWEELPAAPLVASASTGFQYGSKFFVLNGEAQFSGYGVPRTLSSVDLGSGQWHSEAVDMPADLAETHAATALVGGRHLFIVAGQKGAECSNATATAFRLDLETLRVQSIPNLPEPRYSPAMAMLGDGRLHLFGGLLPDRATPARDHWSLAVNLDGSTGDAWVEEPLLPAYLGGSHATVVELQPQGAAESALYYWGRVSQESQPLDVAAGNYSCVANREWGDAALWSFSLRRGWRRHRDLPLPLLYTSGCTLKLGQDAALVVGGQHYEGWLSRTMWLYNATEDSWSRLGDAPVYSRGHVCGLQQGRLFMALGQQGRGNGISYEPGPLSARQFWAALPPELA